MPITPEDYASASAYDLLAAAARGHAAFDHRLLRALLAEPARSVPDMVRFGLEDRDDRIDLEEELILIARHLQLPEFIPFLVDRVRQYVSDVPDALVETVACYRGAMLEPLLDLYREAGLERGRELPFLLASLGVRDERIGRVLEELAAADPEDGAFCRDIYRDVSAGRDEPERFDIWENFPERCAPPLEELPPEERLEFLDCASPELRAAAAGSFFDEGELPRAVRDRLVRAAREDPAPEVRGAAWKALAAEVEDSELVEAMTARFMNAAAPPAERAGLAVALAPHTGSPRVRAGVLALAESPDTRAAAVEAMWRSLDRGFAPEIQRHLDDPDPAVREQAVMGVGYLGIAGELGRIKTLFDDPQLRPAALMAYALATPAEISPGRVRGLLARIEELAGGLDADEGDVVRMALDTRLAMRGMAPVFFQEEE